MVNLDRCDLIDWQSFLSVDESSDGNAETEEAQDKVKEVFTRKTIKKWSKAEEEVVKEAFRKYNAENPEKPAYSSPCIAYESSAIFVIAGYPQVALLGRQIKQLREKWVNDLCPNSLGGVIKQPHRQIIEGLREEYPNNQWDKISTVFANRVLEDKSWGQYYSNNTIRNHFMKSVKEVKNRNKRRPVALDSNLDAIKKVAEGFFAQKTTGRWSKAEEEVVKEAFRKYSAENPNDPVYSSPCESEYNPFAFSTIAEYPEVALLGRSSKQIREKWINELCPNSLGTKIKESHQQIIKELYQEHDNKWAEIVKDFAKMVLSDKSERQYYSSNTIKIFLLNDRKRIRDQYEDSDLEDRNKDPIEELDFQSKGDEVFTRKAAQKWTNAEVEVVIEALRKYNAENSEKPAYSDPDISNANRFAFSVIAEYPEVASLGRSSKQIREKWINELCPNSLGTKIKESHRQIIKELYQEHGKQWAEIVKIFAKMVLSDKSEGQYYSSNTLKNFLLNDRKRTRDQYEDSPVDLNVDEILGDFFILEEIRYEGAMLNSQHTNLARFSYERDLVQSGGIAG